MHPIEKSDELPSRAAQKPVVQINKFVRKHVQAVDLRDLNEKGITKVNLLTFSKINDLVSLAVMKAMEKYRNQVSQSEIRRVQEEAREELARRLALLDRRNGQADPLPKAAAQNTELLERRIAKLKRELEEMEENYQRLVQERGLDSGVASIYREVQGLSLADTQYEKKRGMLRIIFEENWQLQKAGQL